MVILDSAFLPCLCRTHMFSKVLCCVCVLSCIQLFATSWTTAGQAPLSMECSRQECWSGLPCPPQRIFPTQGLNLHLLRLLYRQAGSSPLVPPGKTFFKGEGIQISRPGLIRVSLGWETLLHPAGSTASESAAHSSWRPGTMRRQSAWEQGTFLVSFPFLNFFFLIWIFCFNGQLF